MTVQDIITRVQNELEDATGGADSDWTDADYILSKLATLGDDIGIRLQLLDLNYSTNEVILPAVAANTIDLWSKYQSAGQPLSQMIVPKSVEWRLVGETQEDWTVVGQVDKLIDTDTGTGIPVGAPIAGGSAPAPVIASDDPTVESWEWRQGKLRISACMEPVDLRVRFAATVISLTNNSQQQIVGLTNVYVYKCCEKICASRGVGTNSLVEYFSGCYEKSCGDFEGLSVKAQQSKVIRLGGRRSGSSGGWDGGFVPPIVNN